jgi:transcriptional regulator with GAF, ATPase, and Fis domain
MHELKYYITKFDEENKLIDVVFQDGNWAQIRLVKPFPSNIEELEQLIKTFASPVEVIEARQDTEADLSFINSLLNVEQTCERFSIKTQALQDLQEARSESVINNIQIESAVRSVLLDEGILK